MLIMMCKIQNSTSTSEDLEGNKRNANTGVYLWIICLGRNGIYEKYGLLYLTMSSLYDIMQESIKIR